jgi:hypothetical protein
MQLAPRTLRSTEMRSHSSRITTSCHTCQLRLGSLVLVARHLKLSTKGPNHLMSSGFA